MGLGPYRGDQRRARRGQPLHDAAPRRSGPADSVQVQLLDDAYNDSLGYGRRELCGAKQDSRRQDGQCAQPHRRRGCGDHSRSTRARDSNQRGSDQTRGLQPDGRGSGRSDCRRERERAGRNDGHRQQYLQHQGRRRVRQQRHIEENRRVECRRKDHLPERCGRNQGYAGKGHSGRARERQARRYRDCPETVRSKYGRYNQGD